MADYEVTPGDTMSGIAADHYVPLGSLIRANPKIPDPARLRPGDIIHIPGRDAATESVSRVKPAGDVCQRCKWIKMHFDGKNLSVSLIDSDTLITTCGAGSGLPAGAPHISELIAEGRTDLDQNTDYRHPKYQGVKDAGPIPEGTYTLPLTQDMEFQKQGKGWGVGGWLLKESFLGRLDDFLGGRSGFFLHHDGGNPGTAGCIGVKQGKNLMNIRGILQDAYVEGQREVEVLIDYED